jgi:hypothetical protein
LVILYESSADLSRDEIKEASSLYKQILTSISLAYLSGVILAGANKYKKLLIVK